MSDNNSRSTKDADAMRNMTNRKPYRSKALKAQAKKNAYVGVDGAFHSNTEVMFHSSPKGN